MPDEKPRPFLQIGRTGLRLGPKNSSRRIAELQKQFRAHDHVILPEFIAADLLPLIQRQLRRLRFTSSVYLFSPLHDTADAAPSRISEFVGHGPISDGLAFLLNDPNLLAILQRLSRSPKLASFHGRLYKMAAKTGNRFDWHTDDHSGRRLAISINLSPRRFMGGELQIEQSGGQGVIEVRNANPGDAIVFRGERPHRVLPVKGKNKKLALAGWFYAAQPRARKPATSRSAIR